MEESQFVQTVRQWIQADDLIREGMIALREKKEERKRLEQAILDFMKRSEQDELALNTGGLLRRAVVKTKATIKEDYLRSTLGKFVTNPEEISIMVRTILQERPLQVKEQLKRSLPRGAKKMNAT